MQDLDLVHRRDSAFLKPLSFHFGCRCNQPPSKDITERNNRKRVSCGDLYRWVSLTLTLATTGLTAMPLLLLENALLVGRMLTECPSWVNPKGLFFYILRIEYDKKRKILF